VSVRCLRHSRRAFAGPLVGRPTGRSAALVAGLLFLQLAGCVMVPVERQTYDPDCRLARREITLEPAVIGGFGHCSGNDCAALLAALGLVSAASVVVSGSIAVVGNVLYWFEHQGRCAGQNRTP
jgi:hypothetical protein